MKNQSIKITFGIIVLNGEPFLLYNLRSLYPFAHQIIVVEGACPDAKNIANENGHSIDNTLQILRQFQENEDPEKKLIVITAEDENYPNGFWPGEKDEQSNAYAKRATGDYLWQIDIDEFYKSEDMTRIMSMLVENPQITAISFPMITFWGGLNYWVDGWYLRRGASVYHRFFKWGPGYKYLTHRPPTVLNENGIDVRKIMWVGPLALSKQGIFLYHYSLLLPQQVIEKNKYYSSSQRFNRKKADLWTQETYFDLKRPFRVHNVYQYPSWLNRFHGEQPEQIIEMYNNINNDQLRRTDDIERLLNSPIYSFGRSFLKIWDYPDQLLGLINNLIRRILYRCVSRLKYIVGRQINRTRRN